MELHWYLHEEDFFQGLKAEKNIFISHARKKVIRKGEFLFAEGAAGDAAYYLQSGEVRIFRVNRAGRESIVFIRCAGEMFGLAEAVSGADRACSAQAITSCSVYEIKRTDLEAILSQSWPFSRRVMELFGRRLRYLGDQIDTLMSCDVTTRLRKLLFYLGSRKLLENDPGNKSVTIPLRLTQEQIAAMIGSCQQTVSGILTQLQEDGLIRISRKKREITILKPARILNSL